jgi:hypothetical protein
MVPFPRAADHLWGRLGTGQVSVPGVVRGRRMKNEKLKMKK